MITHTECCTARARLLRHVALGLFALHSSPRLHNLVPSQMPKIFPPLLTQTASSECSSDIPENLRCRKVVVSLQNFSPVKHLWRAQNSVLGRVRPVLTRSLPKARVATKNVLRTSFRVQQQPQLLLLPMSLGFEDYS